MPLDTYRHSNDDERGNIAADAVRAIAELGHQAGAARVAEAKLDRIDELTGRVTPTVEIRDEGGMAYARPDVVERVQWLVTSRDGLARRAADMTHRCNEMAARHAAELDTLRGNHETALAVMSQERANAVNERDVFIAKGIDAQKERDAIHAAAMPVLREDGLAEPGTLVAVVQELAELARTHRAFRHTHRREIDDARQVIADADVWSRAHPDAPISRVDLFERLKAPSVSLATIIRELGNELDKERIHALRLQDTADRLSNAIATALVALDATDLLAGITAVGAERDRWRQEFEALERKFAHEKASHEATIRDAHTLINERDAALQRGADERAALADKLRTAENASEIRRSRLDAIETIVRGKIDQAETEPRSFSRFGQGAEDAAADRTRRHHRADAFREVLDEIKAIIDPPAPSDA